MDVLVVGAGQAGLGVAYRLTRTPGRRVLVLDRSPVGQSWLDRWDSLRLFTPRAFSGLPGLRFPAGPGRCPTRTEMAAYLRRYARRFALPVRTGVQVRHLARDAQGFTATTSVGTVRATDVVVAAGPFTCPYVPPAAGDLASDVVQLHSRDYRRPADLPPGEVLVVGGGNSAAQLAVELSRTHAVTVVSSREPWYLPESLLGVSIYWWTWVTGVLHASSCAPVSRYVQRRGDSIVGTALQELVERGTVRLLTSRVSAAEGRRVVLADGTRVPVSSVLWCTGFRPDTSWIDVPGATGPDGTPLHERGAPVVPGLHWVGLPWQTRLSSSIIAGVDGDARTVARRIRAGRA